MRTIFLWLACTGALLFSSCAGGPFDINDEGGTAFVVESSAHDFIFKTSGRSRNPQLSKALNEAQQSEVSGPRAFIVAFVDHLYAAGSSNPAAIFAIADREKFKVSMGKEELCKTLVEEYNQVVDRVQHVIDHRLENIGISESQRKVYQDRNGRIRVEVSAEFNPDRLRKLIQSSAEFGFYETYDNQETYAYIDKVNKELAHEIHPELDTLPEENSEEYQRMKNPLFSYLAPNVQQAGREEYTFVPGCQIGFAKTPDTAAINRLLKKETARFIFPRDMFFAWSLKSEKNNSGTTEVFGLYVIKAKNMFEPALKGDVVVEAHAGEDQQSRRFIVNMSMNSEGADDWEKLTQKNTKKAIAMIIDGQVISAPTVYEPIPNGQSVISGNFTKEEAEEMAAMLRSGKLPVHTYILDEQKVQPKK